jgi:chromosome segregation protein
VLGPLAELITVADGAAEAIAAALGASAGAVAVADLEAAVEILRRLRGSQAGRAELVIADSDGRTGREPGGSGPSVSLSGSGGSPGGTGSWSGGEGGRKAGVSDPPVKLGEGGDSPGERSDSPGRIDLWSGGGEGAQSFLPAIDLVKAPGELAAAVQRLLGGVLVAPDLATGLELVRADPSIAVVTADGDLIGAHWARGGSASGQSLLGLRAAAQAAADELAEAEVAAQRAERQLGEAVEDEESARQAVSQAQAAMKEVDAAAAEVSGRLGALAGAARAAQDEAGRLVASIAAADRSAEKSRSQLADIEQRIAEETSQEDGPAEQPGLTDEADLQGVPGDRSPGSALQGVPGDRSPGSALRAPRPSNVSAATKQALTDSASAARSTEMDARLEVRTVEERLRAISGRADSLAASAQAERQATIRAAERARRRAAEAKVADAVATGARLALTAIDKSLRLADSERQQAEIAHQGRDEQLKAVRVRIREATGQLEKVVSTAHGAEVSRAGRRLKIEQIETKAVEEYAVEIETLVVEYGPDVLIPGVEEGQLGTPYIREVQQKRADTSQRQLDQLGKVNPLALEEFAALEERHAFLVTQLEDLRKTRRDLLTVVKEVDDRVQQVFAEAFADTAREFEYIFGRVFPGGEGKLVLTEPDDMLATGIEFEARPPGKKVKRLSLLSGGERSLTAIAFLVSIFKARPSPFYVMDEVEAALDDTNVGRLLDIFDELRASSQLIIITHQKRTMEIADSLYGVSMRSDGVSAVISQRLREPEPA